MKKEKGTSLPTEEKIKKKRKFRPGTWFYNDRFILIFSVIVSLTVWVALAYGNTENSPVMIDNVPIKLTLPEALQKQGLKVFEPSSDATVTVGIKGNSVTVRQVRSTDMEAVPTDFSIITGPGTYEIPLTINKLSAFQGDYKVDRISTAKISVKVDYAVEKTFELKMPSSVDKIASGYFSPGPVASTNSITVTGPKTQVDQVDHVSFNYTPSATPLTETKKVSARLILYDSDNVEVSSSLIKTTPSTVDISVQVMPQKTVTLVPTFTNKPAGIELSADSYTVSVSSTSTGGGNTIQVAAPKEVLAKLPDTVELAPIDFAQISPSQYTFNQEIKLPTDCRNLSASSTAKVTLTNLKSYTTQILEVTAFNVTNAPTTMQAEVVNKTLQVLVVGPEAELKAINSSNLIASVDLSGREELTGNVELPVTLELPVSVSISSTTKSWVFGKPAVNVLVTGQPGSGLTAAANALGPIRVNE